MKQILIVEPKQISSKDKAKLAKAEILVIEADNPDKVRMLNIDENIDANSYLMSALHAIAKDNGIYNYPAKKFVCELNRRLVEKEKILNDDRVHTHTEQSEV